MCTSRCGVVATVEDGVLTQVNADPEHPNGCICVKGAAAPEIVYSPDRLRYPMVRTRPKGDPDPGWTRITWDQALNLAALRLNDIKDNYRRRSRRLFPRDHRRQRFHRLRWLAATAGQCIWQSQPAHFQSYLHLEPPGRIEVHFRRRHAAAGLRPYAMHADLGHQSARHLTGASAAHQPGAQSRRETDRHRSAQDDDWRQKPIAGCGFILELTASWRWR